MYSTVERMDGCEYSLEIIIVLLKERIAEINFFFFGNKYTIAEKIAQASKWVTAKSPVKINIISFKEWITATLSVTKADILLQRKDGRNQNGEINRL